MIQADKHHLLTVPPYLWMGEWGCLVGPFKKEEMMQFFLDNILAPSKYGKNPELICQAGQWFIDTRLSALVSG